MNCKTNFAQLGFLFIFLVSTIHAETWQVGVFAENSRSPFLGDKRETNGVPAISYIGDRFSYIGGKAEYALTPEKSRNTYLVGQIRQRQFYSANMGSDNDLGIDGMQDRDSAFELGLGLKHQATWGQYIVEGLFDVTNTHKGSELTVNYSYPKQMRRWLLEPAIGFTTAKQ